MSSENRTPIIPTPEPSSANGSLALNGHHDRSNMAVLTVLAGQLPHIAPTPQPFLSSHHGEEARLAEEILNHGRQRDEARAEREQRQQEYPRTPQYLEPDATKRKAIRLCWYAVLGLSGLSWLNGAQFVEKNFTESFLRGLLFCGAIPAIPFIFKYFFLRFAGRSRVLVESVLVGIFLLGFFVFADQFGKHFALKPGIEITAPLLDGQESTQPAAFSNALGSVSLRWYFYGQLILECVGSFVFFSWLLELLKPRPNPEWDALRARLAFLDGRIPELDRLLATLRGKLAELQHHKADYQSFKSSFAHLLK